MLYLLGILYSVLQNELKFNLQLTYFVEIVYPYLKDGYK